MVLAEYVPVLEGAVAKAPGVCFLQISASPYKRYISIQHHILQSVRHTLSRLSKPSSLDLPSLCPLDIENVLSMVIGLP